jgi:hypothetical protein
MKFGTVARVVAAALALSMGLWWLTDIDEVRPSVADPRSAEVEEPAARIVMERAEEPARQSRVAAEGDSGVAAPQSEAAAPATFRIRALHGALALRGAIVWSEHATIDRLGETGADGLLELAEAPPRGTLTARHGPGLVGEQIFEPPDALTLPYEITISLDAGRRIAGQVVHEGTGEPFGDVIVLARATRHAMSAPLPLPHAWWERTLSPGVGAWTRADAGGRFTIDGLLADRQHRLEATGRGHASAPKAETAQDVDCVLAVLPVFGGRFVLIDGPSGAALPAALLGAYGSGLSIDAGQMDIGHYRGAPSIDYLLAEVSALPARSNADAWREVFVRASEPPEREFPIRVYASAPGYERIETERALRRLDHGPVEERLALTPMVPLGRLRLRFEGLEADPTAMRQFGGLGHLSLASPSAPGGSLDFGVSSASGSVVEFVVPAGTYRYRFTARERAVAIPAAGAVDLIEVVPGETRELVVPWPAARASIQVELSDAAGRPYHGPAFLGHAPASRVKLDADGKVVDSAISETILPSPPYVLVDVPAGRTYVVSGHDPSKGTWVDVPESGTVRVRLTVGRP